MLRNIIVAIFLSLFTFFWVYALSNSQKGAILDIFKEKQYNLLFESDLWDLTAEDRTIFNVSNKINLYNNIENNAGDKRKIYEQKNLETVKKILSLKEQIVALDKQMEESSDTIAKTNTQIIEIKKEVDGIKNTIAVLRKKILENRNILLGYLEYLYKKKNTLHLDGEIDNVKSILLNTEDIWDLLNDVHFKGMIQIAWKKLIDKHRKFVSEIYVKKIELEKKEVLAKKLRKSLIIQRKVLNDKKEFKENILRVSKGKQYLYERYINDKLAVEKSLRLKSLKARIKFNSIKENLLERYGCEFVDITKNSIESRTLSERCLSLNKIIHSESKLAWFHKEGNNIFTWPINPILWISAYFHDKGYKEEFWSDHDAIDIVADQWTLIKSPADWYVVLMEPPETQDYSYLAIRHANGYVSVYGHLSEIMVGEYDFVKEWQVFARTWGEFGTNGAGFMTTWPHLHMEVFEDKKSVDPLNFMSLADIPFAFLPEKYRFKFYSDFKEKRWYAYKQKEKNSSVFKLEWDTEIERQKYLISKYAVGSFNHWQMWVDESLDGNIDPTFVMCIGLAETSLWKNMKTPFNIWNVWNTDSWATKAYLNARSWVYWIVRTLNNRILWHHNEVKDLSRYGNKTWPIYASSPDHWHNNIIKCMSHIKWRYVPDDYNFRIIK